MSYFIIKAKNKELFYNYDDAIGNFMCDTPALLNKELADIIWEGSTKGYHDVSNETETNIYYKRNIEIKEIELKYI